MKIKKRQRQGDGDLVKGVITLKAEGVRGSEWPTLEWGQVVEKGMKECGLTKKDAKDHEKWRRSS